MENGACVVAIEAMLDEVFAGERCLFCEEGDVKGADGCIECD